MSEIQGAIASHLPDFGAQLVNGYQSTLTNVLGMFSGLAASIGGAAATTSATVAADRAAAAATVAGAATSVSTAANVATAAAAGVAQGAQDAVASAAQALLSEVVTHAESALVSVGGIADNLQLLYSKYEAAFCKPAYVVPSVWMPPNVTGPGFQADFLLGNCSLTGDPIPSFNCAGPSATFTSTPASFTAKYKKAVEFVGEQCAISKSFGEVTSQVLFVFDPAHDPLLDAGPLAGILKDAVMNVFNLAGATPVSTATAAASAAATSGATPGAR
ncbi:hypothetical protein WJX81_001261 [Elliptochloris bilobata]|uniref:Uncharacterized protein n=1 Tax=Elliptochloris bilobata TaxID=381761 RepID=A0AAW1SL37_9CHLO